MKRGRLVPALGLALAVVLLAAVIGVLVTRGGKTKTVMAMFATAPGIFKGNHVDVLGVQVGTIESVKASSAHVAVKMSIKANTKLGADAGAVILAPEVVADRYVEISPYTGGPVMPSGGTIPASRTAAPESVDTVIDTLNNLAQQLGPNGANRNGALTSVVSNLARQLKGNGPGINRAITNTSTVLGAAAAASPQLKSLLVNLGSLSQALGDNAQSYKEFAGNLAAVTSFLAADKSNIGSALANLQQFFANLTQFINQNQGTLGVSLKNLGTFAQALASKQVQLAKVFDLTPLTLQNLNNAIDLHAPGGPALRARYDPEPATPGLFTNVCGNTTLRFLVVLASGTETNPLTPATTVDSVCAVGNALAGLTPPPGSAPGPDLTLAALAGGATTVGQS